MCGASYHVVDPAVGDLRSSSISENAVLHTLDTRIFPQVPEGWFVFFHLCTHIQKISPKKLACDLIELVIFDYFVQLTVKLIHIY